MFCTISYDVEQTAVIKSNKCSSDVRLRKKNYNGSIFNP